MDERRSFPGRFQLAAVPGVQTVEVFLTSEKAVVRLDLSDVPMNTLHTAVERAGYSVPETPIDGATALATVRTFGVKQIELLTGDTEQTARQIANELGIVYRAQLLPEDKIAVVKQYQAQGHTVVMVGDGVNDAPALAQADVGIAMGVAGTDVAMDAAHMALMRDDWSLVPEVFAIAHRMMRVVKMNLAFTAIYNLVGLSLAAFGVLPPIVAAAAQSLPDLGILANSSRLLRQPKQKTTLPVGKRSHHVE